MYIVSDCCGAEGAYDRLIEKLQTKELVLNKIKKIKIEVSAKFHQYSYAGSHGGYLTDKLARGTHEGEFDRETKEPVVIEGITVQLILRLHKRTREDEP